MIGNNHNTKEVMTHVVVWRMAGKLTDNRYSKLRVPANLMKQRSNATQRIKYSKMDSTVYTSTGSVDAGRIWLQYGSLQRAMAMHVSMMDTPVENPANTTNKKVPEWVFSPRCRSLRECTHLIITASA